MAIKFKFVFAIIGMAVSSCVYDPPPEGYSIYIENQTGDFVFVIDSITADGYPKLYDTFVINGRKHIGAQPNCIPRFSTWENMIFKQKIIFLEKSKASKMVLYFIQSQNLDKSFNEISKGHLYDSIHLNIEGIKKDLNYLYYYPDTIVLEHDRSLTH